ncbi:DUF4111 domain-containing protein [Bacillaceae bacterium Marseille-Q3522]|nr:DUF4111 domain-containing protein [Bacillaceae bacterium Marseille-Q3522]
MTGYQDILEKIKIQYTHLLRDNLTGIYVHGSIAFQCFNWDKSDIDFIVVVKQKINVETKLKLLAILESLRTQSPPKGLEMSVVLEKYCEKFMYPTPYELHFSNAWLERYLKDPLLLCNNELKTDPDLAAHFTVIKNIGIVLCGRPIGEVFGEVDRKFYIDSLINEIADAENEIMDNPVYIILNLCRVLAYLQDGFILSKQQGGEWGITNLDKKYHHVIQTALSCYSGRMNLDVDEHAGMAFCEDVLTRIQKLSQLKI